MKLNEKHLADLKSSGLSDTDIEHSGCYSVTRQQATVILGFDPQSDGLAFPYPSVNGKSRSFVRIKPDTPFQPEGWTRPAKYLSPRKADNHLYLPIGPAVLKDPSVSLIVCEGEKKALAATVTGFPTVALSGVWCWTSGRDSGTGQRHAIPDINLVEWKGRTVFVAFDSDKTSNQNVQAAERALADHLKARGADVRVVCLPSGPDGAKVGLDDYLVKNGPEALGKLLAEAQPPTRKARGRGREKSGIEKEKPISVTQTSFKALSDGTLLEMCHNPERSPSKFFARFNPETGEVDYPASVPLEDQGEMLEPFEDRMPDEGVILLPSEAAPYESVAVLLNEVRAFIHRYVGLSPTYELLTSFYVLLTWIYDSFNVLPYLRALGDWGTGKSRFLTVIGSICYKPIFASGATTPSPIFRMLQKYAGTLILDEADWRYSDAHVEIIKILNCGYSTGFPVLRSEGESNEPKAFRVFGPKIIGTREEWKDKALESRCLTENMDGKFRQDVPYILPHSFTEEARQLRNQLLTFRFRHYGPKEVDLSLADSSVEPRLNQVMLPLASVIEDGKVRETFKGFVRAYNARLIADRGLSLEATVVEAISKLTKETPGDDWTLLVKDITERVKALSGDDQGDEDDDQVNPRRVSWRLRKRLHLDTKKTRGGAAVTITADDLKTLREKYGLTEKAPEEGDKDPPF